MTEMKTMQFSLAPEKLWQAINPWTLYQNGAQFGIINISGGITPRPDIEEDVLQEIGSYGRQLGWMGDVLEILMKRVPQDQLSVEEQESFAILEGKLAEIRKIKRRNARV
ncbi:MAG: hypothetical protein R3E04_04870 [Sphingobium sp.]